MNVYVSEHDRVPSLLLSTETGMWEPGTRDGWRRRTLVAHPPAHPIPPKNLRLTVGALCLLCLLEWSLVLMQVSFSVMLQTCLYMSHTYIHTYLMKASYQRIL